MISFRYLHTQNPRMLAHVKIIVKCIVPMPVPKVKVDKFGKTGSQFNFSVTGQSYHRRIITPIDSECNVFAALFNIFIVEKEPQIFSVLRT